MTTHFLATDSVELKLDACMQRRRDNAVLWNMGTEIAEQLERAHLLRDLGQLDDVFVERLADRVRLWTDAVAAIKSRRSA